MDRRFAIIGNRAPSSGKLNLNDLPGDGGRMDVLVRAVNSALFISHGIRKDTQIVVHLMGGSIPRRVFFDGCELRGVRPDERSIADPGSSNRSFHGGFQGNKAIRWRYLSDAKGVEYGWRGILCYGCWRKHFRKC